MKEQQQRKYAKLILEVGVHLVKGQKLIVSAEAYHIDFLTILTEEAYKMGAAYVLIDSDHPQIFKARIDHADTESLESLPHWLETKYACMIDEEWARVRIFGPTLVCSRSPYPAMGRHGLWRYRQPRVRK